MSIKDTKNQTADTVKPVQTSQKRPNEVGSLHVEGFVKIYDPKTKEVFLESRT